MSFYKSTLPKWILFICGIVVLIASIFVVPEPLKNVSNEIQHFTSILTSFAICLGAVSLGINNVKRTVKKQSGWCYSIVLLISLIATIGIGISLGRKSANFMWIYNYLYMPLQAAIYSILFFQVGTAVYRTFIVKNPTATVLLIFACLTILGGAPAITCTIPGLTALNDWILAVPQMSGSRGIMIGLGVGIIGISVRTILGREKAYQMGEE